MDQITWVGWAALAASAFLTGVSKTGLPGVGILGILVTAAAIPAKQSTGMILPMLIVGDLFAVAYYRRHAVWGHLVKLLPCAAAGIVVGWRLMNRVNNDQLSVFLGVVILGMLALNWWRSRRDLHIPTGWWFPVMIGLAAGVTTMMGNAAGPIMVIYLLAMRLPKEEFLGTGAWYYLILNCFKVPFSWNLGLINADSLTLNAVLLPLIAAGALSGVRLAKHIPQRAFNAVVQALAVLAAAWLSVKPFAMR